MCSRAVRLAAAALVAGAAAIPCYGGRVFTFEYSLLGGTQTVSAAGTLTTGDRNPVTNAYLIEGISGTRTVNGVPEMITSLIAPGGFANSNLLYASGPLLDGDGLAFTVVNQFGGNDGFGNVNVYFSSRAGQYTEYSDLVGFGTFTATPQQSGSDTPEPSTALLLGLGVAAVTAYWRARRQRARI